MSLPRWISAALLLAALTTGTLSDSSPARPPLVLAGYRVLQADFHAHPFPFSWSTLAPWDLVLEARRQGLDAIAIAGHNHVWPSQVGRWFSRLVSGPTVISSEEIHPPRGHIIALGIEHTVNWRLPTERAIDEVHRQGGVAIAAHPSASSWPLWTSAAIRKLDAVEVLHPNGYVNPSDAREFREFYARTHAAPVGDSDFHGLGPPGLCRTFVFATDNSEPAILEALRAGRTIASGPNGQTIGDPNLLALADWKSLTVPSDPGILPLVSRLCAILGLVLSLFRGAFSNS